MFWFDYPWQIQTALNNWWWPINVLLLAIIVVQIYLAFKKPLLAHALVIACLPLYLFRSSIGWVPFTFLEVVLLIAVMGWFIPTLLQRNVKPKLLRPYIWPIVMLLIGSLVGLFIAPQFIPAAGLWKAYILEPLLFFMSLQHIRHNYRQDSTLLYALSIPMLVVAIFGIIQYFTGFGIANASWQAVEHRRITSLFTSPNAVGLFLVPGVMLYCGWMMTELRKRFTRLTPRLAYQAVVILLSIISLLFTDSTGSWLALGGGILFLLFISWRKMIVAGTVALITISLLLIPATQSKIVELVTFQDPGGQNRLLQWNWTWEYLTESPKNFFLGAGILGYADLHEQRRDPDRIEALLYPHNIVLNFWMEFGLLGMLALLAVIGLGIYKALTTDKNYRWIGIGAATALVVIVIHGIVDVPYFKNDLAILFWLIIAYTKTA